MMATATSRCPDDDTLALFLEGGLDGERESDVRSHMSACDPCRSLIAAASRDPLARIDPATSARELLGRKYSIEGEIGSGGMGLVYKARHLTLERVVAIKLVHPHLLTDATVLRRFEREARATASLASPHVVRILDIDWLPTGNPFIVMEYLEGCDLSVLLDREGPLPPARAVRYVLEACEALREAHAKGIIHRDVKPQNLFLAREGGASIIKVLDFGLAKLLQGRRTVAAGSDSLAMTGGMLGSPYYMSPEQIRSNRVDARTDVWSMGATLYMLLCGQAPFTGPNLSILRERILGESPRPMSRHGVHVTAALEDVVRRCLRVNPEERWPTIEAFSAALEVAARGSSVERRRTRSRGVPLGVGALVASLASLGVMWAVHRGGTSRAGAAPPPAVESAAPVASETSAGSATRGARPMDPSPSTAPALGPAAAPSSRPRPVAPRPRPSARPAASAFDPFALPRTQ